MVPRSRSRQYAPHTRISVAPLPHPPNVSSRRIPWTRGESLDPTTSGDSEPGHTNPRPLSSPLRKRLARNRVENAKAPRLCDQFCLGVVVGHQGRWETRGAYKTPISRMFFACPCNTKFNTLVRKGVWGQSQQDPRPMSAKEAPIIRLDLWFLENGWARFPCPLVGSRATRSHFVDHGLMRTAGVELMPGCLDGRGKRGPKAMRRDLQPPLFALHSSPTAICVDLDHPGRGNHSHFSGCKPKYSQAYFLSRMITPVR